MPPFVPKVACRTLAPVTTGGTPQPFAVLLRRELDSRKVSVRELARRVAGPDATEAKIEQERRSLSRYLSGRNVPQRPSVSRIEQALGLAEGSLPSKDDAPRPQSSADVLAALDSAVRSLTDLLGQGATADALLGRLDALAAAIRDLTDGQSTILQEVRDLRSELEADRQPRTARPTRKKRAAR